MAPHNLWGSSDASSSIYSTDDDPPIIVKPVMARKDSASANSAHSSVSKNSTVYSEDTIKILGYRPLEYWKGPRPAGPPTKRQPPPLPPPRYASRDPTRPVNALQDFKPLPKARVVEVQTYMLDAAPPSPRVKDRYMARMAERARRKRERMQRIEAWPGWVPDEKVLGLQQQRRRVRIADDETEASRQSSLSLGLRERWTRPRTWRRRVWGIVVSVGLLVLIAVIVVTTTVSQDNAPSLRMAARSARLNYRLVETVEVEDLLASPPLSLPMGSSLRSSFSSSSESPAPPRRILRGILGQNI